MESTELPEKAAIKKWLTEHGKDRAWLAGQIGVKVSTVDNWLSRGRKIPETKHHAIAELMQRKVASFRDVIAVPVRFTAAELEALQAALPPGANLEDVLRAKVLQHILPTAKAAVEAAMARGADEP